MTTATFWRHNKLQINKAYHILTAYPFISALGLLGGPHVRFKLLVRVSASKQCTSTVLGLPGMPSKVIAMLGSDQLLHFPVKSEHARTYKIL